MFANKERATEREGMKGNSTTNTIVRHNRDDLEILGKIYWIEEKCERDKSHKTFGIELE